MSIGKLLYNIWIALGGGTGPGPGGPVTIANGADVCEGSTTDAAVSTDAAGTVNAHIRGLIVLIVNLLSRWPAALGQGTMAQSLRVVIASDQSAVKNTLQGAANVAYTQVTAGASAQLLAARATRRQALIKNIDTAITVYIGTGTVTSSNSMPLLPGQSAPYTCVGALNCLAASGSPVIACQDEYD